MMQVGGVFEGVEAPANHVDLAAARHAADVVSRARQRLARGPTVGLGVVDLMPADARAFGRGLGSAAYQVQRAVQHHGGRRAARPRQRRNGGPAVGRYVVDVGVGVGAAVLFDEAAKRIDAALVSGHRHMVGTAR
jgi:hypothetical protein